MHHDRPDDDVAELLRKEGGRVLATLIRFTGDFDAAEDAVHDAVLRALETWPTRGRPDNPGAWLTATAKNMALDRLRRESRRPTTELASRLLAEPSLSASDPGSFEDPLGLDAETVRDDQLRLIFTCCHPALSSEARLALTLRSICGLTTSEIAGVHLIPESTMAQRLSRAKRKIAVTRIPYRVPADHELPDRLPSVLSTIYAVFTAGHHPSSGGATRRVALAAEGVRLGRMLFELMPDEPECAGLLALTLAVHARRNTRVDTNGRVVLLEDQDRAQWHHREITEAGRLVELALIRRRPGPYQIQAAIACLHGLAPTFAETDWPQIATLYELLHSYWPTTVVRVNQAVAIAYVRGPEAGLTLLRSLPAHDVERWHLYWSTCGELLWRGGYQPEAIASFQRALTCDMNDGDREFLVAKLATYQGS
jgi:RNA polymerase sigma-70 factor, ECF subfamily